MASTMDLGIRGFVIASIIVSACGEICWYPKIYNSIQPSMAISTDAEPLPRGAELAKICPTGNHTSLVIRCYDNNDVLFHGTKNGTCEDAPGHYLLTCAEKHGGMLCAPHKGNNCSCPDFKAQFGCECAQGISGGTTQVPGKATDHFTNPATGNGHGKQTGNDGSNRGGNGSGHGNGSGNGSGHGNGSGNGSGNGGAQLKALAGWTVAMMLMIFGFVL